MNSVRLATGGGERDRSRRLRTSSKQGRTVYTGEEILKKRVSSAKETDPFFWGYVLELVHAAHSCSNQQHNQGWHGWAQDGPLQTAVKCAVSVVDDSSVMSMSTALAPS